MINFRNVTEENFSAIINMKHPEGESFVASNCYSLAQAWLYREDGDIFPFAIYCDDTPVGFIMLEEDTEESKLWLWRILISAEYIGMGYGTEAIRLLARYVQKSGKYNALYLDCNEKNTIAMHVYQKIGFQFTGDRNHGDLEMCLDLRKRG